MARKSSGSRSKETEKDPEELLEEEVGSGVSDLIKKMAFLGAGTLFATQETASRALRDMKLPREAVQAILQAAERNRDEFIDALTGTLRDFLEELDLIDFAKRTLDGMNVRISAEVGFSYDPSKSGKKSVRVSRRSRKKKADEES